MSDIVLWPRLPRRVALAQRSALRGRSLPEVRLAARTAHPEAEPGHWAPPVTTQQIGELQARLRATADELGWPAPIEDGRSGELDRTWARTLQSMQLSVVDAAAPGTWGFVALVVVPDLALWRFPGADLGRFFGVDDHVFGRLWWRQHVLGADLLDGAGREPLTEDELVAVFRRHDLIANPVVTRAVVRRLLEVDLDGDHRLRATKQLVLEVLRATPTLCIDVLDDDALDELTDELLRQAVPGG
jgi:hypothetical protein